MTMKDMHSALHIGLFAVLLATLYSCVSVYADTVDYSVEYTSLVSADTKKSGFAPSYAGQLAGCKSLGGVPVALGTNLRFTAVTQTASDMVPKPNFFFIGATAEPTSPIPTCKEFETGTDCVYRFMFGFNSRDTSNGQPGSGFFKDTKIDNEETQSVYASHLLNNYYFPQKMWARRGTKFIYGPRGYFYLIFILSSDSTSKLKIVDSKQINDPEVTNVNDGYALVCEMQKLMDTTTTTMIKQPRFRQTWKTLTWAQTYWWVIFLIVGVIVLAILLFIVVYCCYTRKEAPPGQPVHSMVVREVKQVTSAGKETHNDSQTEQKQPLTKRSGIGFNVNPLQGPQDVDEMQQPVSVYSAGEGAMVYGDSDLHAQKNNVHETNDTFTGDLGEGARVPRVGGKRTSARRVGRTMSNTFSEVELPEGDEIKDEGMNI